MTSSAASKADRTSGSTPSARSARGTPSVTPWSEPARSPDKSKSGASNDVASRWSKPAIADSATVLCLSGDTADSELGSDLLLADTDENGVSEIYTVDAENQVYKLSLLAQADTASDDPIRASTLQGNGMACTLSQSPSSGFSGWSLIPLLAGWVCMLKHRRSVTC